MKSKEIKPNFSKLSFKEKDGEFYSEGFIATTHADKAANSDMGVKGDILTKQVVSKIVDEINDKFTPGAGGTSYRHDWIKQDNAGLPLSGIATVAELREMENGHWGAWVDTHHNKMHDDFEKTKYEVEHQYIPGYSIEYETTDYEIVDIAGDSYRKIKDLDYYGYGFADARNMANEHALIEDFGYKEIMNAKTKEGKMTDEKPKVEKKVEASNEPVAEPKADAPVEGGIVEPKKEDPKADPVPVTEPVTPVAEPVAEPAAVAEPTSEKKTHDVSAEEYKIIQAYRKSTEMKERAKEFKELIAAEFKEKMPMFNTSTDKKPEMKEIKEFQAVCKEIKELDKYHPKDIGGNDARVAEQKELLDKGWASAGALLGKCIEHGVPVHANSMGSYGNYNISQGNQGFKESRQYPKMEIKELQRLEVKASGLQFDTNADGWTYGSYNVAPAEYNDIFQAMIISQLNDQTVTLGKLQKKDFSGSSQIQVRVRDGRNSTTGGYSEGANLVYGTDFTGTVGRLKLTQPFSYYRVLVAVTGQALQFAKSPGGIGDLWSKEVSDSSIDLAQDLNAAIIGTGDGTSESVSLGFEGLILGTTGNLYGRNIATYTTLKSHKETVSAYITLAQLRKMSRYVRGGDTSISNSNAKKSNLVFFMSPTQKDIILSLIQSMQRIVPTSARVGFEGVPEFDSIPIFEDPDYNTDDIFLIDTEATYIAQNLAPTLEPLPVTADAKAAHIKTYFNLFCDRPSNNYWSLGLST